MAEEQAKEQNTLVANALKAILKQKRESGIFRCFDIGLTEPRQDRSMNFGHLTTP
jgi:hypothetical protein